MSPKKKMPMMPKASEMHMHPYSKKGSVMRKAMSPQYPIKNQMHKIPSEELGEEKKDKEKGE